MFLSQVTFLFFGTSLWLLSVSANADDFVSKANGYVVVAPVQGSTSVSKANGYVVVAPVQGSTSVSKANGYVVIAPVQGSTSVSKLIAYVVVAPAVANNQPQVFITTKNEMPASCVSQTEFWSRIVDDGLAFQGCAMAWRLQVLALRRLQPVARQAGS